MVPRHLSARLLANLADTPIVLLSGARQTGKTTLVRALAAKEHPAEFITFDDAAMLAAAKSDPTGFIAALTGPVILDEIQRAPELLPAVKLSVDRDRRPGRFLLTGSANVMVLPKLSETLAGRMTILTLWPLSQGELEGSRERFAERLLDPKGFRPAVKALPRAELIRRIVRGGYPEMLGRTGARQRAEWLGSYLTTLIQRDVRDMAQVEKLSEMTLLLKLLAARTGGFLNVSEVSRNASIRQTTLKRYLALFAATYLLQTVPAWSGNLSQRVLKAPKIVLNDTGLLSYLVGADEERLAGDPTLFGHLLENFVAMEVIKQLSFDPFGHDLYHFRTYEGSEVDLVLESRDGRIVGLEVKGSASLKAEDFNGLRALAVQAGRRFLRGVVLYTGTETVPFGKELWACPVQALWAGS